MSARPGTVYLVGAGPGDPGLLTVRGLELLQDCDVVLYDRLVGDALLDRVRPDAELVFVGKRPGETHSRQVVADALLIARAKEGKSVVRLKGGDPFVFGRGAEEALLLRDASVPFEIVPGVSSAIAVPAYAGIPVTHRGVSGSFVVLTARDEAGAVDDKLSSLTVGADTIVLLMGVAALDETARRLVEGGRSASEPAATIAHGTSGTQRTVMGDLGSIAAHVRREGIKAPATTVIGNVVSLRDSLAWFEARPLFGHSVAVTRPVQQSRDLSRGLASLGADVVSLPLIAISDPSSWSPLDDALKELAAGSYEWVLFASANAVGGFFSRSTVLGLDARALAGTRIAAVGKQTAHALEHHGLRADLVPASFTGDDMATALGTGSARVLFPRVESGPRETIAALAANGWEVNEVPAYANSPGQPSERALERLRTGGIDVITLTSASTAENLATIAGEPAKLPGTTRIVCIGPSTRAAAERAGFPVHAVADPHTHEGLIAAVLAVAANSGTMSR